MVQVTNPGDGDSYASVNEGGHTILIRDGLKLNCNMHGSNWLVEFRVNRDLKAEYRIGCATLQFSEWMIHSRARNGFWNFMMNCMPIGFKDTIAESTRRGFNVKLMLGVFYDSVQRVVRDANPQAYDLALAFAAMNGDGDVAIMPIIAIMQLPQTCP